MTFCKEFSMPFQFKTNVSFPFPKDSTVEKGRSKLIAIKNNEEEQVSLRARATLMLVIINSQVRYLTVSLDFLLNLFFK